MLRECPAQQHGGGLIRLQSTDRELPGDAPPPRLGLGPEALERQQQVTGRLADVGSLRASSGLRFADIGDLRDVSRATAQRNVEAARAPLPSVLN